MWLKSRVYTVAIVELLQLAIGIPFAIIGIRINPNAAGNMAGIEANMAFFGLVLIMYCSLQRHLSSAFLQDCRQSGYPPGFRQYRRDDLCSRC